MLKYLRNGVPIEVPECHAYDFYTHPPLRVGDEAQIITQCGRRVHVQLLRGPGRKRYLVEVKGLKQWLRADAKQRIDDLMKQRGLA